ncbi:MAG TPA: hypothetical protein PKC28_04455 [Bdellovibrionales bacterium]|nr:hypothetical protein [Bdellovibrionales bacterium]
MSDRPQPVVKKVRPYPFDAVLDQNNQKTPVEVIFLSPLGVIVRLKSQIVHVGEFYKIIFGIPVINASVETQVRVIKTTDKSLDTKPTLVDRVAELHFQALTPAEKMAIAEFVHAIGQEQ